MDTAEGECGVATDQTVEFDSTTAQVENGTTTEQDADCADGSTGFTVPRTGVYSISAALSWGANTTGDRKIVLVEEQPTEGCAESFNDGATFAAAEVPPTTPAGAWTQVPISVVKKLSAGTTICVIDGSFGFTDALTLNANQDNYLSLEYLGG
jgi:hypothetical protein